MRVTNSCVAFCCFCLVVSAFLPALLFQGGILQDNFEEEKAIECFNRTIQIDPEYADAHYK